MYYVSLLKQLPFTDCASVLYLPLNISFFFFCCICLSVFSGHFLICIYYFGILRWKRQSSTMLCSKYNLWFWPTWALALSGIRLWQQLLTGWCVVADGSPLSWWLDREGERRSYWGGFLPGVQQCSCSLEENCMDMNYFCNCDADTEAWYINTYKHFKSRMNIPKNAQITYRRLKHLTISNLSVFILHITVFIYRI